MGYVESVGGIGWVCGVDVSDWIPVHHFSAHFGTYYFWTLSNQNHDIALTHTRTTVKTSDGIDKQYG